MFCMLISTHLSDKLIHFNSKTFYFAVNHLQLRSLIKLQHKRAHSHAQKN